MFRWGFHLIGREVADISEEEHRFAWQNMLEVYEQYLKNAHYTVVVEGLFTWDDAGSSQGNVKELVDLAAQYDFACKSIVLKAEKQTLLERNARRNYAVPAEEFEALHEAVYRTIDSSEIVYDSTDKTVEETVEQLYKDNVVSYTLY